MPLVKLAIVILTKLSICVALRLVALDSFDPVLMHDERPVASQLTDIFPAQIANVFVTSPRRFVALISVALTGIALFPVLFSVKLIADVRLVVPEANAPQVNELA